MLTGLDRPTILKDMKTEISAGAQWAARVYAEKLAKGDLPNLGAGFSDELRAARAVSGIADRKLFVRSRGSSRKLDASLAPRDRQFWTEVLDWANAQCIALSEVDA